MVGTRVNASVYTILGADDYAHGNGVRVFEVGALINAEAPGYIGEFYHFFLTGDPANFINSSVAEYYGLNSLVLYVE